MTQYEVRIGKNSPFELWSIVEKVSDLSGKMTKFENFVCEGTHAYCVSVKEYLS